MIAFKRQVRLQVYLPLGVFVLLLAAVVAWFWIGGVGEAGVWADVGLIMLLIPALFVGLIMLALFLTLAILVGKLVGLIPEPANRLRLIVRRVEKETRRGVDLALNPLMNLSAIWSALKAIGTGLAEILGFK